MLCLSLFISRNTLVIKKQKTKQESRKQIVNISIFDYHILQHIHEIKLKLK